jgi:hypothetical protein
MSEAEKLSGYDLYLFGRVHVRMPLYGRCLSPVCQTFIVIRYWGNIPDPILGPKGVRPLLFFRGLAG